MHGHISGIDRKENLKMNTINKNMVVVYNSFSDDRFGGTESIRVWNYGDNIAECLEYTKNTIENWKNHFKEYLQKMTKRAWTLLKNMLLNTQKNLIQLG